MLKKGLLLMYTCVLVFLLCGCGNPLEELPEATGENIYDTEEETTGNEAADEMIETLLESFSTRDRLVSFAVLEREDNEESRDYSRILVEFQIENEAYNATCYYTFTMDYRDKRGWRVEEGLMTDPDRWVYEPLIGVEESRLLEQLYSGLDSFYIGNEHFTADAETTNDISFQSGGIRFEEGTYYETVDVTLDYVQSTCCDYRMECTLTFSNYFGEWTLCDFVYPESYEVIVDENLSVALTEERMLEDIAGQGFSYNYYIEDAYFTTEDCNYTLDATVYNDDTVEAVFTFTSQNTENFIAHTEIRLLYYFDGTNCELLSCEFNPVVENICLAGNYTGVIYNPEGERLGDIYYSFLGADEDGNLYGAAKWTIDGLENRNEESVEFTVYQDDIFCLGVDFAGALYYEEDSSVGYDYLYMDPVSGGIVSSTYAYFYELQPE